MANGTRLDGGTDTILRGVTELHGRFTAHTGVTTKTFKTLVGAERYLAKFGLNANGERVTQ
jgi:hypothetical protein